MASTAIPSDALDSAKAFLKDMPLERVPEILDDVHKVIWMAAPWRWTVGVCAPVTLSAGAADFNMVSAPSDVLYILRAYIWDGTSAIDLTPEPALPSDTDTKGQPNKIAYVPGTVKKFRIHPVYGSINTAKTYKLVVWYKKISPIISAANMDIAGTLVMDDEWFHVFRKGVLAEAFRWANDDRVGNTVFANGQIQYTGQTAVFMAALQNMKLSEPLLSVFAKGEQETKRSQG